MKSSKEKEGKTFLMNKMTVLEGLKSQIGKRDEIVEETVGQAHCETVAIKLFSWADDQDRCIPYFRCVAMLLRLVLRNCNFGKAVIKAFYTASNLFETLRQFGELSLEVEEKMKYSKVKAVYLSACLKTGETPVPGNPLEDTIPLPVPPPAAPAPQVATCKSHSFVRIRN